jgi:hypothetical protein
LLIAGEAEEVSMPFRQKTLAISTDDEPLALRLLSALILGWDRLQFADQGWLLRDAFVMLDGGSFPPPDALLAFVNTYKDAATPKPYP